jgi:prolyl-tRNA editing enzyme YbaK/EbsC (Cys-tRNA(Pro) deacylase)
MTLATDPDDAALEARVLAAVEAAGGADEVMHIDPALADTADFCAAYGWPMEASANCIVVASRDDEPVVAACLALATTRLDVNGAVRRLLGVKKLSFAPAELTLARTGMRIGGVTPFGLPEGLAIYADARIAELDRIIVGGGSRAIKLIVTPSVLEAAGVTFVTDLAKEAAPADA